MSDPQCYFCGHAVGDVLEAHPVVPPRFDPPEDRQRHVTLCANCRVKFDALTGPLVSFVVDDAAEGATSSEPEPVNADSTDARNASGSPRADDASEPSPGDDADASSDTAPSTAGTRRHGDVTIGGSDAEPERLSGPGEVTIDGESQSDDGTDDERPDQGREAASAETPLTGQHESDSDSTPTEDGEPTDDDAPSRDDESDDSTRNETEPATGQASESAAESPSSPGSPGEGDVLDRATYRRVLRLLHNREFPVRKAEVAEVAMSAYELSEEEFRVALNRAVADGVLAERDGTLFRSENG
ncbi:hypothetical protein ACFQH6_11165 [Halobacteriaceae archaeon GCM10025711]